LKRQLWEVGCFRPPMLKAVISSRKSTQVQKRPRFPLNRHPLPKQCPATPPLCYSVIRMGMFDKKVSLFLFSKQEKRYSRLNVATPTYMASRRARNGTHSLGLYYASDNNKNSPRLTRLPFSTKYVTHQLCNICNGLRCGVVDSTLGYMGNKFESEHRLFSHHSASAFSKLRSLS